MIFFSTEAEQRNFQLFYFVEASVFFKSSWFKLQFKRGFEFFVNKSIMIICKVHDYIIHWITNLENTQVKTQSWIHFAQITGGQWIYPPPLFFLTFLFTQSFSWISLLFHLIFLYLTCSCPCPCNLSTVEFSSLHFPFG